MYVQFKWCKPQIKKPKTVQSCTNIQLQIIQQVSSVIIANVVWMDAHRELLSGVQGNIPSVVGIIPWCIRYHVCILLCMCMRSNHNCDQNLPYPSTAFLSTINTIWPKGVQVHAKCSRGSHWVMPLHTIKRGLYSNLGILMINIDLYLCR